MMKEEEKEALISMRCAKLEASGGMAVTANAALCTAGDGYPCVIIIFKSYALNGLVYYGNIRQRAK